MRELQDLVEKWDQDYLIKNLFSPFLAKGSYERYFENIKILRELKFIQYQPISHPIDKDFLDRLIEWLYQFSKEDQPYLFYFSSKIIYFTYEQLLVLMENLYERKIKRLLLNKVIEKKNFEPYSYLKAQKFFDSELKKTFFVGLTDSSRINEFCHRIEEIKRHINTGLSLETLLFSTKKRLTTSEDKIKEICKKFEKKILSVDELIKDKERLVILEDFCGSGSDVINYLSFIEESYLHFTEIIISPYIITFKAKRKIEKWINTSKRSRQYYLTYGTLIPEEMKCFDQDNSYLKTDWFHKTDDICEKIKEISEKTYEKIFQQAFPHKYGFGNLKIAFVYYFNCPDNSLPIIWFNKLDWKPLFKRSSRIY